MDAPSQPETRVTGWVTCSDGPWYPSMTHGGFAAYRVWQQADGHRWHQRHEWKHADGTTEIERWINGVTGWLPDAIPDTTN